MKKLNTIIIDDESNSRNILKSFLTRYCPIVHIISEAKSVDEAVIAINAYSPQLVFLDINMPVENGFKLFEKIPAPAFYVIFLTAHNEFAIKAIKHRAFDYLLKPIDAEELVQSVHKVTADILEHSTTNSSSFDNNIAANDKLALPVEDGLIYVGIQDIIRCEAESNYTLIHFTNRPKILVSRTLGQFEEALKPYGFIRVHNSHLINKSFVEKYQRGRGGTIIMNDKKEIIVSQRKKSEFLNFFGNLLSNNSSTK